MNSTLAKLATAALVCLGGQAAAQSCGGTYTVKRGDSLSAIADSQYKDVGKWSAIHQANIGAIGPNPARISVGMKLNLTCIDGLPLGLEGGVDISAVTAAAQPLVVPLGNASVNANKINLLTGDDYAPFTDRDLPNGGLFTEVVQKAMTQANPDNGFAIHWVNDWSAHFEPLLSNALLDVSFPWIKPDCESQPDTYRCTDLKFSDPIFEMLILLFVNASNPITYTGTEDVRGKTICRPEGYATFFFDSEGRNWLKNNVIELVQPGGPDDCFEMLAEGEVDMVAMNEFTGRKKVKDLNLKGVVDVAAGLPLAIQGLHVVAHKSHPQADELLSVVNAGLRGIKSNGAYQTTIDEHMTRIWADF